MTSTSLANPGFERCERPLSAPANTAADQPGRLAQGPEEKHGLAGRRVGFIAGPRIKGPAGSRARRASYRSLPATSMRRTASSGDARRVRQKLKDRQPRAVRQPSLADLIFDRLPGGGERRVRRAADLWQLTHRTCN